MTGVILADGTWSQLHPLTRITNKHLLPVYENQAGRPGATGGLAWGAPEVCRHGRCPVGP
jgi:hypothetical protein